MGPYLDGKVAIVTGVSSGLGLGIAKAFCGLGAQVVGLARRADRGQALEAEIGESGGRFSFIQCDVADPDQCQAAVDKALTNHGKIDILVNNAGTSGERPVAPIERMTEADWDSVFAVNLRAAFTLSRLVLPQMQRRRDGVILNIASLNGVIGVANMAAYNASKAGLLHFTQTLAVENAGAGVRAIGIVMGGVDSEMSRLVSDEMARTLHGEGWTRKNKLAPAEAGSAHAEQYGRAFALLCSDDAKLITGAQIAVDGGATAGALASRLIYLGASELL